MSQFKRSILVMSCGGLLAFSCGKKKENTILNPQYGPLNATSSSVTVSLQGCKNNELVSCTINYVGNLPGTSGAQIKSHNCSSGTFTADFTAGLISFCSSFSLATWSTVGSVVCSGDKTSYEAIAPLSVTDAPCPL